MASKYAKDQPAGFKNHIENVAIVGAGGNVGSYLVKELLKTGKHTVTAITRSDSTSTLPEGVKVAKVDYSSHASLVEALRGQDALMITMSVFAPPDTSIKLVEAAAEAGVPWILPNEFGDDYTDEQLNSERMVGNAQLQIRQLIESKGVSAWIAIACGFWYEYSLSAGKWTFGFDFANKQATFYNDGKYKMHLSTWPHCGRAVAKILSLPILPQDANDKSLSIESYRNSIVRIYSFFVDQQDIFESILRVTGDKREDWTVSYQDPQERYKQGVDLLKQGNREGFGLALYSRDHFPGSKIKTEDMFENDTLGLPKDDLDEFTALAMKWAKTNDAEAYLKGEKKN